MEELINKLREEIINQVTARTDAIINNTKYGDTLIIKELAELLDNIADMI